MVDFIKAFKQGQAASERVKNNNQEIDSVFKRLNEELATVTGGEVKLNIQFIPNKAFQGYNGVPDMSIGHYAICASNNELAEWEKARGGYPCKITIGNKQHYCEDKPDLEETLASMLQDPIVAGILTYGHST